MSNFLWRTTNNPAITLLHIEYKYIKFRHWIYFSHILLLPLLPIFIASCSTVTIGHWFIVSRRQKWKTASEWKLLWKYLILCRSAFLRNLPIRLENWVLVANCTWPHPLCWDFMRLDGNWTKTRTSYWIYFQFLTFLYLSLSSIFFILLTYKAFVLLVISFFAFIMITAISRAHCICACNVF